MSEECLEKELTDTDTKYDSNEIVNEPEDQCIVSKQTDDGQNKSGSNDD